MVEGPDQIRVLIVSSSPYTRYVISGELSQQTGIFVVGTARTCDEIVDKQALLRPDLVVVDLESSRELADLERTVPEIELPILALCSQSQDGARLAFGALEMGLTDVAARADSRAGGSAFAPELLRKVRGLARVKTRGALWHLDAPTVRQKASPRRFLSGDSLIVVSASTGGVEPLVRLVTMLPVDLNASLLVLSPLPECWLYRFLRYIDAKTAFLLRQARDGMSLKSGVAYFTSYDAQVLVGSRGFLSLASGSRQSEGYSSVDKTLSSLATRYGPAVLGVILSGLGRDGVQGALDVRASGGSVIAQEISTCLAEETPRAVIEAGAATAILSPEGIAEEIARRVGQADVVTG